MKITVVVGPLSQNRELASFVRKWNALPSRIAQTQSNIMNELKIAIKAKLRDDERPDQNKTPWRSHNYRGSLADSVFTNTTVSSRGWVASQIGYGAEHGIYMEPAAKVVNNVFVPKNWSGDPLRDLTDKNAGKYGAIPAREVSVEDLYDWAFDILRRRTTGPKQSKSRANERAMRWANNMQTIIREAGQKGYPIIIPMAEALFQGFMGRSYADRIIFRIQDIMGLSEEVPF